MFVELTQDKIDLIAKIIKSVAIEFLEAKKPFVVENSPISAKAKIGKLISGVKKIFSSEPFHKNNGARPSPILPKKSEISNPFANSSSIIVVGL